MAKIAIVMRDSMSVASVYEADAPQQHRYGGPWGRAEEALHLMVPEGMDADCVEAVLVPESGVPGEEGYVAEHYELQEDVDKVAAKTQRQRDAKLAELRKQRDVKLGVADNQLKKHVDADPNAVAIEADWKTYRIALRDITSSYKDVQDPSQGTDALDAYAEDLGDFDAWPVEPS